MRTYTWTLFRLTLLLGLIACLVAIPFIFINTTIKPSNTSRVFFIAFFLLLLKYALADPLVVVENMGARQALKRSWEMTKGHFVYVLGCYLFLWGGTWLIDWPLGKLDVDRLTGVDFIFQLIRSLIDTLWVVMSWCMYLRIKAADQPPVGHSESASEAEGFPAS
ncbi:MAG: glycerophosphoryl diester phosphodiesterase membrane domain-containing protein [Methylacidiphilales bacterium]|nr:glycerophosphoryl diester phosphodiesterase membrane domain-containing protein [Candidatus Methylacidiphilales bacterium]